MTFDLQQDTVYALTASGNLLYAARASGLYRSDDGGVNWHNTFASLNRLVPLSTTALAVEGSTVFAGVNGAVLCSEDSGESWQIVALSSPPPQVTALVISPNFASDNLVVAATPEDGIFVSTDRGASFTPWNFGLIDLNVYALAISPDFARDQTIFAGTVSGIFQSLNGGRSWRETSFPMDVAPVLSLAISADSLIYAGTEAHGLFVSDDFGAGWRQVNAEFASAGVNAVQTTAAQTWTLIEDRLFSSSDGISWLQHDLIPVGKVGIALLPYSGGVLVGCANGDLLHMP